MSIATSELRIDDRVKGFIASPCKLLIDGQWVEAASGKTFPTFNPATGEGYCQFNWLRTQWNGFSHSAYAHTDSFQISNDCVRNSR